MTQCTDKLKQDYPFNIELTFSARSLARYMKDTTNSTQSKNKLERAYVVCMSETLKWFSLGSYFSLSDLPDLPRFKILRDVVSQLLMDGHIDNYTETNNIRRLAATCTLADKINQLYKLITVGDS